MSAPSPALLLGAHLSIAGGLHLAIERAAELRCTALQIFTRSARQWRSRPLSSEEIDLFRATRARLGPIAIVAHAGYLINLAAADAELRQRSVAALIEELERCEALGIAGLVVHPGAHMGAGAARGTARIAASLRRAHAATRGVRVRTVLENTAGQGTGLGHTFAQLAAMIDRSGESDRLQVCLDTAHALAAGYDFRTPDGYARLWEELEHHLGAGRLAVLHLNDALREAGSRVDRHTHIGHGCIGARPFGWLLRDPRLAVVPKVIETPKEDGMDRRNLARLRRLARG